MPNEVWRILYVVGMVIGIGFCALCVLMCVLIGVMVIRACLSYDDDESTWPEEEKENKEGDEGQSDDDDGLNWSDKEEESDEEERVWLVREKDGTWVRTEGKKVYMKVGEGEESDEQVW